MTPADTLGGAEQEFRSSFEQEGGANLRREVYSVIPSNERTQAWARTSNDGLQPRRVARDSVVFSEKCRNSPRHHGQIGGETSKIIRIRGCDSYLAVRLKWPNNLVISSEAQSRREAWRSVGPQWKSGSRILAAHHVLSGAALAGNSHSFRRYGAASAS
jgi:hypothetical protein